jgi:hypothetical protein
MCTPHERLQNSIRTLNVRIRTCADERERRALIAVRDAMRDRVPAKYIDEASTPSRKAWERAHESLAQ